MDQKICFNQGKYFFLFLSLLILSFSAYAQENAKETQDPSSIFLLELGEKAYARGRTPEAIQEFSKVLMLDPANEQAKKRLKDLGLTDQALLAIKPESINIADLSGQISADESKINQLQEEKGDLVQEFKKLQEENSRLAQERMDKEAQIKALKQKSQPPETIVVNVLEDYLDVREKDLEEVQKKLAAKEAELNNKNNLIEEQEEHLKALQEQLKESPASSQ